MQPFINGCIYPLTQTYLGFLHAFLPYELVDSQVICSRSPADICKKMEKEFKRLFQKMLVGQEGETKQALRSSAWEAIKQTEENLALCIIC